MAKISKNARVNRGQFSGGKDMVKVIRAVKSKKSGAYSFRERIVHKDNVKDFMSMSEEEFIKAVAKKNAERMEAEAPTVGEQPESTKEEKVAPEVKEQPQAEEKVEAPEQKKESKDKEEKASE